MTAEQVAEANLNLGDMYRDGDGVPKDDAEAVRWYRLAAEQGHARAAYNLGLMYETGEGVPQDYVRAHMWYKLAGSRSTRTLQETYWRIFAGRTRDSLATRMTPDQIAEAQRLATEWDAAHTRER